MLMRTGPPACADPTASCAADESAVDAGICTGITDGAFGTGLGFAAAGRTPVVPTGVVMTLT